MSITYPEAQASSTTKRAVGASAMNSGSALFPSGATGVYDRAAKARASKNMPLAWVAAPVAVVLIGGAVYLSATHQKAAPSAPIARTAVTTTTTTAPAVNVNAQPTAPVMAQTTAQTTRTIHAQTTVKTTGPAPRANPSAYATRTTTISHGVAAPVTPAIAAPAPAAINPAPAAPTPGTFAFTPAAANAVTTTPDTVVPTVAPAQAPAPAPTSDAQPAPQA